MKNLFIGLVVGACGVWVWFHTEGKISITETKTVTNQVQVTVSVTETQIVEQINCVTITKTNEVWKTNVVERTMPSFGVVTNPVVQQKVTVQSNAIQPATQQITPAPVIPSPTQLKRASPAGKVTASGDKKIKMGIKRNMDGSVKQ